MLYNTPNQPSKFRAKHWIEINDDLLGAYNTNSQIKFKTSMLKSNFCDYSNAYIHVKRTKTIPNTGPAAAQNHVEKKKIKNCAPFTHCKSEINNRRADNVKDIDMVRPMYDLIK